jgi:hypothetical protein
MNIKEIKLTDGGAEKIFVINRFKATRSVYFVNKALGLILKGNPQVSGEEGNSLKQQINTLMQTGINVEGANQELPNGNILSMLFGLLKSALSNLSDAGQEWLLTELLSCVVFRNGVLTNQLTPESADDYISEFTNLYKLCWEVLKHNYGFLLPAGSPSTPTGSLATVAGI